MGSRMGGGSASTNRSFDAALELVAVSMEGDTIAVLRVTTSLGEGRRAIEAGIELTRNDCIVLATRLLNLATAEGDG